MLVFLTVKGENMMQLWFNQRLYHYTSHAMPRFMVFAFCMPFKFSSTAGLPEQAFLKELSSPIAKLSEAYHEDGWCVFGALGSFISECAVSRHTHNISNFLAESSGLSLRTDFFSFASGSWESHKKRITTWDTAFLWVISGSPSFWAADF